MAKGRLRKTDRVCALCRNWNGTVGIQVEMKEKETCYQRTGQTQAMFACSKFEPRY